MAKPIQLVAAGLAAVALTFVPISIEASATGVSFELAEVCAKTSVSCQPAPTYNCIIEWEGGGIYIDEKCETDENGCQLNPPD